jgi:hypothetical protein
MKINTKMRIRKKESIESKIKNMHGRDKKEEHEGERKCRVSKAVLQGLGAKQSREQMVQCTSFLKSKMPEESCCRNIRGLYSAMNG